MAGQGFNDFNSPQWEAFTERAAIMEIDGKLSHNAAIVEALKCCYPSDYAEIVKTCNENGLDPMQEIPALIDTLQREETELIKAAARKLVMPKKREGMAALEYMISLGIPLIGAYDSKATINNSKIEGDYAASFTAEIETIKNLMAGQGDKQGRAKGTQIKRFNFIPADYGLLCLDIDRKPGKPDGIQELLKVFDPDTLPDELREIEKNFPCYVKTPSNGYHLYFKYEGPPIKGTNLFTSIETKHGSPGLTAPGSVNAEGKPYILHGDIEAAPPLFGLILAKIQKGNLQKQETKAEPVKAAADKVTPNKYKPQTWQSKPRIDLDTLAAETSGGNHDRQVSFAGKVCRFQNAAKSKGRDYSEYTLAACLAYVKSRPDTFGTGADTESTIKSVFNDNGGI